MREHWADSASNWVTRAAVNIAVLAGSSRNQKAARDFAADVGMPSSVELVQGRWLAMSDQQTLPLVLKQEDYALSKIVEAYI